jgi:hypothetical protein
MSAAHGSCSFDVRLYATDRCDTGEGEFDSRFFRREGLTYFGCFRHHANHAIHRVVKPLREVPIKAIRRRAWPVGPTIRLIKRLGLSH